MPGLFFEVLSDTEFSVLIDVARRDLRYAITGRFHGCGGSDPLPTILRQVSGMKSKYISSITPPKIAKNQNIALQPRNWFNKPPIKGPKAGPIELPNAARPI
jgi:hypothetical protein